MAEPSQESNAAAPLFPANPAISKTDLVPKRLQYAWPWILSLLGLDYFSTLAYQPSITYEVAGRLGPLATAVVVLLAIFGVVPVYCYLAGRSPGGFGSVGMLETVVHGWRGKTLVLVLLGFAAADFVMLKTISLADAAEHLRGVQPGRVHNIFRFGADWFCNAVRPYVPSDWDGYLNEQLVVTLFLSMLGFLFWFVLRKGFNRNVIALAAPLVVTFLLIDGFVIAAGIRHLLDHPEVLDGWVEQIREGSWDGFSWEGAGWSGALFLSLLFLPNLALGLSGFEMSMILMPQIRGSKAAGTDQPAGRIRNTRKVLISAVLIMSVYLLGSVLVTTLLIPEEEQSRSARFRALSYLAHGGPVSTGADDRLPLCGPWLGVAHDVVTVLILSFAGTSVMTALSVLLPRYLLRFGMELRWADRWGVLLMAFAAINLLVTLYFKASVDAQRGAYTTSVLVLMTAAALVVVADRRRRFGQSPYFIFVAGTLLAITLGVAVVSWSSILIASLFILAILAMSVLSRAMRVDELRTIGFEFKDEESKFLWDSLRLADFPILVPHRPGKHERDLKEAQIRRDHQLAREVDVVFLEIHVDDPSNFFQNLLVEVIGEEYRFVIKVTRAVSIPHAVAAVALEMSRSSKPPGLHFGWSDIDLLSASWTYLAFGEGNIPWKVRELILRAEPDPSKQPRVIVG